MWNMWLHFLSWKRKLFQYELQISIWHGANYKEEYANFYRNSVETSLFSLFLQGKIKKKRSSDWRDFTSRVSQKNFPDQAGIFLHDLSSKAVHSNIHLMTNQKTVRDENGNITLFKRTNFQSKSKKNKSQKCQIKLWARSYNEGNTNAYHK